MKALILAYIFFLSIPAEAVYMAQPLDSHQMVYFSNKEQLMDLFDAIKPSDEQLDIIEAVMAERTLDADTTFSILASQDQPLILLVHKPYEYRSTVKHVVKMIRVLDSRILGRLRETVGSFNAKAFTGEIREIAESFLTVADDQASADVSKDAEEEFLRHYDLN